MINVPKTGEVNALKIEAVNKLTFEPVNPAALKIGMRDEISAAQRWAEFSAVPKSGECGNGRNFAPVKGSPEVRKTPCSGWCLLGVYLVFVPLKTGFYNLT